MSLKDAEQLIEKPQPDLTGAAYYNQFINEDEEMPEGAPQFNLIKYLVNLMRWHYRAKNWFIIGNLAVLQPGYNPVGPDVAVFKGMVEPISELDELASWRMSEPNRPAPAVVFEVGSEETWRVDLNIKPGRYGQMGVREYFMYDPRKLPLWTGSRLKGWRYNAQKQPQIITPDRQGRIWSKQLGAWLVDERPKLRLYDSNGQAILEQAEEEQVARQIAEKQQALEHTARILAEERANAEREELQKLLAKLKEHGINPDDL